MSKNLVITIGRECGSGGKVIGQKLAEKLGIKCYDKELIAMIAKESGLSEDFLEQYDEKKSGLLSAMFMSTSYAVNGVAIEMPANYKAFLAQFEAIKKLGEEESCVIVGRCADYILRENPNLISIYICGDEAVKAARLMKIYGLTEEEARKTMRRTDKGREGYYNYYTMKDWGSCDSYDLVVNSSRLGEDGTVDLLLDYIARRQAVKEG